MAENNFDELADKFVYHLTKEVERHEQEIEKLWKHQIKSQTTITYVKAYIALVALMSSAITAAVVRIWFQ